MRKNNNINIIVGDFNSRLQYRLEAEKDNIGEIVFGRGQEFADQQAQSTTESRDCFIQFCMGWQTRPKPQDHMDLTEIGNLRKTEQMPVDQNEK